MKRSIIKVDRDRCKTCGHCVVGCNEGALKLVDNRVVLVDDRYCFGIGACLRYCVEGALSLEVREAEPYSEEAVLEQLIPKGSGALREHFMQLLEARATEPIEEGLAYLREHGIPLKTEGDEDFPEELARLVESASAPEKKPAIRRGRPIGMKEGDTLPFQPSELMHFPIKLNFINPEAGFLRQSHMLLAADCTAFACGAFHTRFLRGKNLAIFCPRLETHRQTHIQKLVELIDHALVTSLTVVIMDLPCCEAGVQLVKEARGSAKRYIPFKLVTLELNGNLKSEKWV